MLVGAVTSSRCSIEKANEYTIILGDLNGSLRLLVEAREVKKVCIGVIEFCSENNFIIGNIKCKKNYKLK